MTHDELLAKIDSELVTHGQRGNIVKHSFALRAGGRAGSRRRHRHC